MNKMTTEKLQKQIKEQEAKLEFLESEIDHNREIMEESVMDFYKDIQKIQNKIESTKKPFFEIHDKLNKKLLLERNKLDKFSDKLDSINSKKLIKDCEKLGIYNVNSIKVLFRTIGINIPYANYGYDSDPLTEKKALKNGIQIFRIFDSRNYTEWFFFYKTKLVGYSFRKASEHQADTITPYSFLAPCDNREKAVKIEKLVKRFYSKNIEKANVNFTEFCKIMEKKNPEKLQSINIKNEKVKNIIINHCGLRF